MGSAWLAAKCWHRRHAHCTAIYELCPRNCYCILRTCCQGSHFIAASSNFQLSVAAASWQLQLVAQRHATAIKFVECPPNWQWQPTEIASHHFIAPTIIMLALCSLPDFNPTSLAASLLIISTPSRCVYAPLCELFATPTVVGAVASVSMTIVAATNSSCTACYACFTNLPLKLHFACCALMTFDCSRACLSAYIYVSS